ncbi:hypothetical protein SAMN05444411_102245 [Lutibacter oricola]|uniref:Phage replication protein O n=1 Tax=Lutibacter oricola TaxID=762486 RepID=A0A1H2WNV7_9FLAO|nr:hypothetical protein [Lutibacter oricola]SDW82146.1 hypothetical protein SAMN05444411_102245 [Lutibacter oricola]
MDYYKNTTQTPNSLFDNYLKTLGCAELKVLLVIIRQTIGFIDVNTKNKRKDRDWISQRFFMLRSGLSGRSVSSAISSLVLKGLILVTNENGDCMHSIKKRRGTSRLYYSSTLVLVNSLHSTCDVLENKAVKKAHTTKLTHTKMYSETNSQALKKISDAERIHQILHQHKN